MKKIETYMTVEGHSSATLDGAIQRAIEKGFEPFGNPYVHNNMFYQAMIKNKKETEQKILND